MGEIKFRVWDSERKQILQIQRHSFKTGKSMPYGWNMEYVFDGLMQYTGLKDKNGKEIYEGDIVWYFKNELGVVKFLKNCFCIESKSDIEFMCDLAGEIEIVGNIYENPEMISR